MNIKKILFVLLTMPIVVSYADAFGHYETHYVHGKEVRVWVSGYDKQAPTPPPSAP